MARTFDLVIRAGDIVDGSGADAFHADVAIDAGRIVEVGRVAGTGREEVDARGLLVTRITSYNVCYTKLLRPITTVVTPCDEDGTRWFSQVTWPS